jgi:SAM-dependent methyltransferase
VIPGVHQQLERLEQLSASDYADPDAPVAGALPSVDLEALSYPNNTFDLVLTSETLEHVPDLTAALREVYRVLKPGGSHIFTVPLLPLVEFTFRRTPLPEGRELVPTSRQSTQGAQLSSDRHITIRHPGGDWGYLVHTEFGRDFADILRQAGFETEMRFGPPSDDDLAQVWICRKRRH